MYKREKRKGGHISRKREQGRVKEHIECWRIYMQCTEIHKKRGKERSKPVQLTGPRK